MTSRNYIRGLSHAFKLAAGVCLMMCLLLMSACGESVDLRLEQARIAMANDKPDRALSIVETVLSDDPANREAMLIQARAQVSLGRLRPAKLILDRLERNQPDDPAVSSALLVWSISTIDAVLVNPAFASTPADVKTYDDARSVADEQIAFLRKQAQASDGVEFNQVLLHRSDLLRTDILIRHTRRMIKELGPDALVDDSGREGQALPDEGTQDDAPAAVTYAQQLDELQSHHATTRGQLLAGLEVLLDQNPRHQAAADIYLRIVAGEMMWDLLLDRARRFGEVSDLPVSIADQTVTLLLGMPESASPMADRIELGWALLSTTPEADVESEARLIASSRLYLAADKTDKVLPILGNLIEEGSTDPDAFYMYAQALFATGDYEKCREVMSQMFPAMDAVAPVQMLYGLALARLGEVAEARVALRTACQLDPSNTVAADAFATLMAQQGFIGASGEDVDAFYQLDPTNPRAIQFKMQHAATSGDTQQIAVLLAGIESREEHSAAELGLLYYGSNLLNRDNAANRWARELVARQPDQLDTWKRLASTQLKQGDEAGLAETLDQITARFPDSPNSDQLTGELYLQAQQYEHAVAALGVAVEQDPGNTGARTMLARALAAVGRFNSALEQVQIILEASPDDTEALALGSRIAYAAGDGERADAYLDLIDPDSVDQDKDPALAAHIHLRRGDLDTAAGICTDAIAAGNLSPMLRLVLAGIYQERGEVDRAEENLVAMIRHFPNSSEAFAWLGQFYVRLGQVDRGVRKLKELEVYNETLASLTRAGLLNSADRVEEAIGLLDPLLDRLIHDKDRMALPVADKLSELHKALGHEASAMAVYDRLYAEQEQGSLGQIQKLIASWDSDTPARRMANLDAAAARVSADDTVVLIELSRRYAMLGRADQSLSIVQRGLTQAPDSEALLGVKAGVLVMLGRASDAVEVYRRVLELTPDNEVVQVRYARALSADGKWAEAEDVLTLLIRGGGAGSHAARAALLETYHEIGLHERVSTMVNALLDKLPVGEDASLDRVIGKSLMAQGRHAEAQHRLAGVGKDSAYYPSVQVLYAQSEAEAGDMQAALSRVATLVQDPVLARRGVPALLVLDLNSSLNRSLLVRADSEIDVDSLPYGQALRWLALRVKISDQQRDWKLAQDTLQRVARLDDDDDSVTALQVVLLYRRGQLQEAAAMLRQSPRLEGSATGSLLSFALDTELPEAGRIHPMADVLNAIVNVDHDSLELAVKGYAGIRTLFPDDIVASLSGSGAVGDAGHASYKDLAMATVAIEGRMPGLAEALSASAVGKAPESLPAYGMLAAALIENGEDVQGLLSRIQAFAPDSSLVLMLDARVKVAGDDHRGAISPLTELAKRHPSNAHVTYQLAQELNVSGLTDETVQALTLIADGDGPYRMAAMNDLAYLLAEQGGDDLEKAVGLARTVLRALPTSPAVLDTAGWVEHHRGRDQAALALMAQAIPSLSDVPEAHYHLGVVYHSLGRDRWARHHLGQAASGPDDARGVVQARELLAEMGDNLGVE
jgi:tetratricopeptide (TPR) repeat protein